jgi:hypothetical protein
LFSEDIDIKDLDSDGQAELLHIRDVLAKHEHKIPGEVPNGEECRKALALLYESISDEGKAMMLNVLREVAAS